MKYMRKQPESEEEAGAPEWMVTFSDCMTLLLTFFVLLLSFSSFDNVEDLFKLKVIFAEQFSCSLQKTDKESVSPPEPILYNDDLDKGSETPTLERGEEDNLKKETEPVNFRDHKVFLISSGNVFYGNGTIISLQGRKTLSNMALFLKEVPSRVVISENGGEDGESDELFGLRRAWAVIEYFATKQGLDKSMFSIAASTLQEDLQSNEYTYSKAKTGRMLEIVLLERSIYN